PGETSCVCLVWAVLDRASRGWRGFTITAAGTRLLQDLRRQLLLVPAICYLLAWASYRSAVAAARRFCDALAVAFDLYHLRLWDAMALPRPRSVDDVVRGSGELLTDLLAGHELTPEQKRSLAYERGADPEASVLGQHA